MPTQSPAKPPTLQVGVDEAGLGPTLGPLCIGAFATEGPTQFMAALGDTVTTPGGSGPLRSGSSQLPIEIGDSKRIHSGARKLARLERSALACWMWAFGESSPPATTAQLLARVSASQGSRAPDLRAPWYRKLDEVLPVACERSELVDAAGRMREQARKTGLRPLALRNDLITASALNAELEVEIEADGSKNTWVVQRTLALVDELSSIGSHGRAHVVCDKAGGRNNYQAPIERAFPGHSVATRIQVRREGRYEAHALLATGPTLDIRFLMKADDLEPRVSVAACLAKYLRELSMRSFNRYFARLADSAGVAPPKATAGYPQDARRFIAEVEDLARRSDLPRSRWIRQR